MTKVSLRSSAFAFALMTGLMAAAATGLFVLLDPRAQAFWVARWDELAGFVRSLLPR